MSVSQPRPAACCSGRKHPHPLAQAAAPTRRRQTRRHRPVAAAAAAGGRAEAERTPVPVTFSLCGSEVTVDAMPGQNLWEVSISGFYAGQCTLHHHASSLTTAAPFLPLMVPAGLPLLLLFNLQVAKDAGADITLGCSQGSCGVCEVRAGLKREEGLVARHCCVAGAQGARLPSPPAARPLMYRDARCCLSHPTPLTHESQPARRWRSGSTAAAAAAALAAAAAAAAARDPLLALCGRALQACHPGMPGWRSGRCLMTTSGASTASTRSYSMANFPGCLPS